LKPCRSCRADRWSHHDVANVSPVGRRYVSKMLKTLLFSPAQLLHAGMYLSHSEHCWPAFLSILRVFSSYYRRAGN
jgi:hypothetical protein